MAKGNRKIPKYIQRAIEEEEICRDKVRAAAKAEARSKKIYWKKLDDESRRSKWANVDPSSRLRIVRPFPMVLLEAKMDLLGYAECVIEEWDNDRLKYYMPDDLGYVRSQADAETLVRFLNEHFPETVFHTELDDEYVVRQMV